MLYEDPGQKILTIMKRNEHLFVLDETFSINQFKIEYDSKTEQV
jgi:hypothetical protein